MILYPAIDLKDGQCVRLLHGDMDKATVFNASPSDQAMKFAREGFDWLHVVDRNGAIEGKAVNAEAVGAILRAVSIPVQLGGGVRTMASIEGWIEGDVVRMEPANPALKVPHMGWNALEVARDHPLLNGEPEGAHMYFTHSFALKPANPGDVVASADHGGLFVAAVARDNVAGVQFHPEKSQAAGLKLLANFLEWRP